MEGTAINADTSEDFWTSDAIVLNANGSHTETVANYNKAGFISETVTTTTANGLFKTTEVDANGALNSGAPVFNLVTTDDAILNTSDGSRTETVDQHQCERRDDLANGHDDERRSADDNDRSLSRRDGNDHQRRSGGDRPDPVERLSRRHDGKLSTDQRVARHRHETKSGNGLDEDRHLQNAAGTTVDTQSDTTTYDANGDGGALDDFEDADVVNGTTTLKSSVKTQTAGNGQSTQLRWR